VTEAALRTAALRKDFGGLTAVNDVALECRVGQMHAVIGPNGAGKTTLINLLSGDLAPSSGRIERCWWVATACPSMSFSRTPSATRSRPERHHEPVGADGAN